MTLQQPAQQTRGRRAHGRSAVASVVRQAVRISGELFKVMVPLVIAVKILKELGGVAYLGSALGPVMRCVGLPGQMGLVWATTLVVNIYGGIAVFLNLVQDHALSVAQITVLGTMMLVAHTLPVELRISQKAGVRLRFLLALRVGGAFLLGFCLDRIYRAGGWLQEPGVIAWKAKARDPSLAAWAWSQIVNLSMIFGIILVLLVLLKVLERLRINALLTRLLRPLLVLLGIGREAATITIVGMTLGLSYGGGLIIAEAKSGRLGKRDVVASLALMNLAHSLIEDTLLLLALGAALSGILWGRLIFSLLCVMLLARLTRALPDAALQRWFARPPGQAKSDR